MVLSGCVTIVDATHDGPIETDPSKRSFGQYIDDKKLKTVAAVNIKKADPALAQARIRVATYQNMVLLTGQVPSVNLKQQAGKTVREISGVRQVFNELEVAEKTRFFNRTKDAWIKTKIKTKLIANSEIESSRVDVIVENKTVYLMGVITQEQSELITDVIKKTRGVKKVVRAIEYI